MKIINLNSKIQLERSNIKTEHTLKPDFTWAKVNIDKIKKEVKVDIEEVEIIKENVIFKTPGKLN